MQLDNQQHFHDQWNGVGNDDVAKWYLVEDSDVWENSFFIGMESPSERIHPGLKKVW